jgi:hypothetical protein
MPNRSRSARRPAKILAELVERVNVANLHTLASCPAAEHWCPKGSSISLRTIIMDIMLCCEQAEKEHRLTSYWEEGPTGPRRYCKAVDIPHIQRRGANPGFIGRSLFCLTGCIRNLARSDLKDLWILDLVNAHPTIMSRRHPGMQHLARYVQSREEILASIPAPRAAAKELFIRLLYGGCVARWCHEFQVDRHALPPFVDDFAADMRRIIELDGRGKSQHVLNTEVERQAIDRIEELLTARGARIHAYEHDGLCFTLRTDQDELTQACSVACGFQVTIEPSKSYGECLAAIRAKSGIEEWDPIDTAWQQRSTLIAKGRVEPLTSHRLFADIVLAEPKISDDIPWPVQDLFLQCPASSELMWYDVGPATWHEAAGGNGKVHLRDYITLILQRRITSYTIRDKKFHADVRHDFGNSSFREGVEKCLRSQLTVPPTFVLDPESSRRYINFCGQAWDRETETFVKTTPSMHISRSTGWRFEGYDNKGSRYFDEALSRCRQEQDSVGIEQPSSISQDVETLLDQAASHMPELAFFRQLVETWEEVIYLLTHLARGTFAIPMAEALHVRSSGRSGKDTTANIVCSVLGSYSHSIAYDALTVVSSPDAPSPTFAHLRARRFVAVREVGTAKMLGAVYKRFTDHNSELSGRALYEAPIRFRPQYLAMFCSNKPMAMDLKDDAIRARTAIIEYSSVFTTKPSEANHRQWRDLSDVSAFRPAVWWMLTRIYHHLIRGRPMRNVLPVPEVSLVAAELDCRTEHEAAWKNILVQPVNGTANATPAEQIEAEVASKTGLDILGARLALQGRGYQRVRRKCGGCNVYFYQYNFTIDGQKALRPQFVHLSPSSR